MFMAGCAWLVMNVHSIVTRYLYLFSFSWYPFLALVPPLVYPLARRVVPVHRFMVGAGITMTTCVAARALVSLLSLGTLALLEDVFYIASLGAFIVLGCTYFDHRSSSKTASPGSSTREDVRDLVVDTSMLAILFATCFSIGGMPLFLEPVIASLLLFGVILARHDVARLPGDAGCLPRVEPVQDPTIYRARVMESCRSIVHVLPAISLAVIVAFLGGLVMPRTSLFSGYSIDGATWRLVLATALGSSASVAIATSLKPRITPSRACTTLAIDTWRFTALSSVLSLGAGIFFITALMLPETALGMVSAMITAPGLLLVHHARGVSAAQERASPAPEQRAWNAVIASLMLGAGSIVLVLLLRVGLAVEMAFIASIALASASILDACARITRWESGYRK